MMLLFEVVCLGNNELVREIMSIRIERNVFMLRKSWMMKI